MLESNKLEQILLVADTYSSMIVDMIEAINISFIGIFKYYLCALLIHK